MSCLPCPPPPQPIHWVSARRLYHRYRGRGRRRRSGAHGHETSRRGRPPSKRVAPRLVSARGSAPSSLHVGHGVGTDHPPTLVPSIFHRQRTVLAKSAAPRRTPGEYDVRRLRREQPRVARRRAPGDQEEQGGARARRHTAVTLATVSTCAPSSSLASPPPDGVGFGFGFFFVFFFFFFCTPVGIASSLVRRPGVMSVGAVRADRTPRSTCRTPSTSRWRR